MTAIKLVEKLFEGTPVRFDKDGWFSATDAAKLFDYQIQHWYNSPMARRRVISCATKYLNEQGLPLGIFNSSESDELKMEAAKSLLIVSRRGKYSGGTWMHPKLAFWFALALDDTFAEWVKEQIEHIAAGNRDEVDWYATRYRAKATFKDKWEAFKFIYPDATSMDYVKNDKSTTDVNICRIDGTSDRAPCLHKAPKMTSYWFVR